MWEVKITQPPSTPLCHRRATSYNNIIIETKIAEPSWGKSSEKNKLIMGNNQCNWRKLWKDCVTRCNKRVSFMMAIDEDLHTPAGKESGTREERPCTCFPQNMSPMPAPELFMEIHKAVSHSPSQPPMRTQVKPHSLQPPNLPQWTGKTLGKRFLHIPWPKGMAIVLRVGWYRPWLCHSTWANPFTSLNLLPHL